MKSKNPEFCCCQKMASENSSCSQRKELSTSSVWLSWKKLIPRYYCIISQLVT